MALSSCKHRNVKKDPQQTWEDSLLQTNIHASFMGVEIGGKVRHSEAVETLRDTLSIDYSFQGEKLTERKVLRTVETFNGRVYQIILETDNSGVVDVIKHYFGRKFHSTEVNNEVYTGPHFMFKNGSITTDVSQNPGSRNFLGDYVRLDKRFGGYNIYKITITDSSAMKKCIEYTKESLWKKEQSERQKERENKHKDDSLNTILEKQF